MLAKDAVLYADGGGKALAAQEPLFGAALIARFMAGVAQVRQALGEFESRLVRVNGQPGRVLFGPGEQPPFTEDQQRMAAETLARLKSGDVGAQDFPKTVIPDRAQHEAEPQVWDVLTVDVVDGRIQAVRIVRNPDKLAHL